MRFVVPVPSGLPDVTSLRHIAVGGATAPRDRRGVWLYRPSDVIDGGSGGRRAGGSGVSGKRRA